MDVCSLHDVTSDSAFGKTSCCLFWTFPHVRMSSIPIHNLLTKVFHYFPFSSFSLTRDSQGLFKLTLLQIITNKNVNSQ